MAERGRPVKSQIRQNIIELLAVMKKSYGYTISRAYMQVFPEVHTRSIYYHLKKGVEIGEIEIDEIREEKGEFSWGSKVEKTYYRVGKNAVVKGDERVKNYFESNKDSSK
jgi:hypothetical protein